MRKFKRIMQRVLLATTAGVGALHEAGGLSDKTAFKIAMVTAVVGAFLPAAQEGKDADESGTTGAGGSPTGTVSTVSTVSTVKQKGN